MKNLFIKMTFAFVLGLFSVQSAYASCESEVEYCGSKFKIYCDGTVDVDLADNVYRYKIFILRPSGNNTIIDIYNNENPIHDVFTAPFNSILFGEILPEYNVFVEVYAPCQDNSNGGHIINFSEIMAANCPPVVEYCGSTWSVNCDGTIDVDLAKDVYRYKVFIFRPSGNNTFVDLYNNEDPLDNFFTAPFNSGIFGQIQPGDNAFVEVYSPCQDNSNGGFIINFSELLACYCSEYSSFLMDQATNPFVISDGSGLSQQDKLYSSSNLKDVNLYPNPATSEINIDLPLIDAEYRINIVDINGKVVKSFKNNGGSTITNTQGLTTGIYFVHIQNDDLTHVEKIEVIK